MPELISIQALVRGAVSDLPNFSNPVGARSHNVLDARSVNARMTGDERPITELLTLGKSDTDLGISLLGEPHCETAHA